MFITGIDNPVTARLCALVATAIICLGLTANSRVDAANGSVALHAASHAQKDHATEISKQLPQDVEVLSSQDATLYRSIFAAQKKDDWKSADVSIASLADRRLMGHVLADRYKRRPAGLAEYKAWLESYADLPEANDIYNQAEALPGAMLAGLSKPVADDNWVSGNGYEGSFGFRNDDAIYATPAAEKLADKIDHALRKGDAYAAETLLETERSRRTIPTGELAETEGRIAASFFYQGRTEAARRLAFSAGLSQNPLALWINGLSAWKQGDAASASTYFAKLAAQEDLSGWDKAAASFWAYRAFDRAGNPVEARAWLRRAAQQPHSFYGILASQLMGQKTAWSWKLPELGARYANVLSARPAGWRALALLQAGRNDLAEAELRRINPRRQKDMQEAMLAVSDLARMPSLTLRLGGLAANKGRFYDAALYPVPPWQPEKGFEVDRALLYALMRRESRFDPSAVSEAGACGLMQIMPNTAHIISQGTIDAGKSCAGGLLDPGVNMALGQDYVMKLANLPMVGNNLLYMLTAYNAGPGNLLRWSDGEEGKDPLFFMETLPVRETRDYVQSVLIQYWSYRARLGEPQVSLKQLAKGEWPRIIIDQPVLADALPQPLPKDSVEVASSVEAQ